MKKNSIYACLVLLCVIAITSFVHAQGPLPCGNYRIDTAAENKALQFRLTNANRVTVVNSLIRVYFHNLKNDDGTNAAITPAQLATEFTSLLASYAADNVCFLNAGTDNINNTFLNTLFNADNDPEGTFFSPYQVPDCINIFYTTKINGNNNACNPPCGIGGIALGGIPGTFFLVSKGNIASGSTVSHEMGHCLGLLHSFESVFGFEKINGSNATTAGDRVTDTPADPFAYQGLPCYAVANCSYAGICPDSNNATNFTPPYTNLMAYWWTTLNANNLTCYPNLAATNGQFVRVNSFLGSSLALIGCSSPSDVTQSGIAVSSGYYMNSAINTFTTSGSVSFVGSVRALIGGGTVHIQPGFHANPSTGGQVRIEVKPCN
jgi:hypothetical protein